MANLSSTTTIDGIASYRIDEIGEVLDGVGIKPDEREFLTRLANQRKVIYNWGQDHFWIAHEPCQLDPESKKFVVNGAPVPDESWVGINPERFHEICSSKFTGQWGPSATDTIMAMEASGVNVTLMGTMTWGPDNPEEFMDELRTHMKQMVEGTVGEE